MNYNNYQVLVDKINELLKENRSLISYLAYIPMDTVIKKIKNKNLSLEERKRWFKIYEEKYKYLQRFANRS